MPKHERWSGRTGFIVTLVRRLTLAGIPEEKFRPAAIGDLGRWLPSRVVDIARAYAEGNGRGWAAGKPRSVVVLSPMAPGIVEHAIEVDWRLWERGPMPKLDADVIIVWRPTVILRSKRVSKFEASRYLLNLAFGGGVDIGWGTLAEMQKEYLQAIEANPRAA